MNEQNYRRAYPKPGTFACKAAQPDHDAPERCVIFGCSQSTERFAGKGLSVTHCRYHVQFKSRHGSYFKRSYSAAELEACRRTAERYLRALPKDDLWRGDAWRRLEALLWWGGPDERPADVLYMKPRDKARAAFARLRTKEIPIERIFVRCLAVELAYLEDPIKPRANGEEDEFRHVQLAKAVMRLAGGHRYTKFVPGGEAARIIGATHPAKRAKSYGIYLRSSGLVLRHVGKELAEALELFTGKHLSRLRDCKVQWYVRGAAQTCDPVYHPKDAQSSARGQSHRARE